MRHALLIWMLALAAMAQTPSSKAPASKAAPKVAAKAKGADLLNPSSLRLKPPAVFITRLETTKGNIDIRVVRNWAPNGVERFYNLVMAGFYDNNYFFRALDFMVQFGIPSRPEVAKAWDDRTIFDDRVIQSNKRGFVTFASTGQPNSRSTQIFINKLDRNSYLDALKFAPFGEVVAGMEVVDQIYTGYGEDSNRQYEITNEGEAFIKKYFPRLDRIIKASVIAVPEP